MAKQRQFIEGKPIVEHAASIGTPRKDGGFLKLKKMIDVKELRIGNWLWSELSNKSFEVTAKSIYNLSKNPVVCNPIPLTEEWLLKFGFKIERGVYQIHLRENFKLRCSFNREILGLVLDEYDDILDINDRETVGLNPIKYVHQLQNLYFALTNEEL